MGIFSFLSAAKTADTIADAAPKVVSGVISGIDAAFFTDEEKARFLSETWKQLYDNFMPRAISRRILAIIIVSLFAVFATVALVFACFQRTEIVNSIIAVAEAFKIGWLTITVTVFYFGYYGFQKIFNKGDK